MPLDWDPQVRNESAKYLIFLCSSRLAVQAVSSEPVSRGHIPCSLGKNREFQRKQGFWSDGRCEKTRQPSVLEVEFPMPSNREFFPTEQGISAKDQGPNSYCDDDGRE